MKKLFIYSLAVGLVLLVFSVAVAETILEDTTLLVSAKQLLDKKEYQQALEQLQTFISKYPVDPWYRISGRRKLWDLRGIWDACISPDGRFIAGVPSRFLGEKTFKDYKKFIMIFLLNKVK